MTGEPVVDTILFVLAVSFSTYASAGEFAIDSASKSKLESLHAKGIEAAGKCLRLKEKPENLRAAVQISNTLLIIISAAIVMPYVGDCMWRLTSPLGYSWIFPSFRLITLLLTAVIIAGVFLVFSSLVAKTIGTYSADRICLKAAGLMIVLTRTLRIPQRILIFIANILLKPFGHKAQFSESVISEENLMNIIEEGTKSGILDQTEHELIESIFQFTDTTAREIMIPRTDIVAVEYSMQAEEILQRVMHEGFTRMPVYKESLDNIVGVIYAKDVVSLIEHKNLIILEDIIRPAFFVPETKLISELLREFQRRRIHLAVVVDEFGGTEGIITLEDILEEIVGEIRDEYDEETRLFDLLPNGSIEVEGAFNVTDLNEVVEFTIPESEDYDTVGGFITSLLGRIPEEGEKIQYYQLTIDIISVDERRIKRARFHRNPKADSNNSAK